MEIKTLSINMDEYPQHLRQIANPPELLYYIGNLNLIQEPSYAIVGTRRASPYGRWVTTEIARRIAALGIPIISGMANGIDSYAHRGCLDMGTGTVAVLGTAIDIAYPRSNKDLYEEIAERGLILSEHAPGETSYKSNFPRRNRIISGLSRAVIVAEGAYKSGSMITANWALSQGRDVFAVPGNINQSAATGTNYLISEGAGVIYSLDELLNIIGISSHQMEIALNNCDDEELKILEIIRNNPGASVEDITRLLYCDVLRMIEKTSALKLKGLVREENGCFFFT